MTVPLSFVFFLMCVVFFSSDCPAGQRQPCSIQPLKDAISVLFSFTRRVLDDTQFQADIHHWLETLVIVYSAHTLAHHFVCIPSSLLSRRVTLQVAVLLHVGGSGEHLFVLCHLLCCPAGVGKWAAPFLQVGLRKKSFYQSSHQYILGTTFLSAQIEVLGNSCGVQDFMQALAILMSPAL